MIKKNKNVLILSSVVLVLPILVGLLLWNRLPDQIPIHWNATGEVDGWGSRNMAVFYLPCFMLAIHWFCFLVAAMDPKHKDIDGKMLHLVLWVCPFISLLTCTLVYATALGYSLSINIIIPLLLGAMFLIIGNYLPKCKHNYTIGIRVSWALDDEGNWNATHRFAGKVWVLGGAVIMATSFLGNILIFLLLTVIMAIIPIVYSYLYYRKHKKGTA